MDTTVCVSPLFVDLMLLARLSRYTPRQRLVRLARSVRIERYHSLSPASAPRGEIGPIVRNLLHIVYLLLLARLDS